MAAKDSSNDEILYSLDLAFAQLRTLLISVIRHRRRPASLGGLFLATIRNLFSRNCPLAVVFAKMAAFIHG
jgi:hypothetical protein